MPPSLWRDCGLSVCMCSSPSLVNGDDSRAMGGGRGDFLSPPKDALGPEGREVQGHSWKLESWVGIIFVCFFFLRDWHQVDKKYGIVRWIPCSLTGFSMLLSMTAYKVAQIVCKKCESNLRKCGWKCNVQLCITIIFCSTCVTIMPPQQEWAADPDLTPTCISPISFSLKTITKSNLSVAFNTLGE